MRGHITKRGQNHFIVLDLGKDPATGKRRQKWVKGGSNKKESDRKLVDLLHQLDNGTFVIPSKQTTGQYLAQWIKDYQVNLSPRGFERYQGIVFNHLIPGFDRIPLTQLKPDFIQKFYTDKLNSGLSIRSVRYIHAVLHVALKTAVDLGLITRNPSEVVKVPKIRGREMKIWTLEETEKFLKAAKQSPYYEIFYLALFTGMRRSELLALRWQDIDLILSQIHITRSLHHLKSGEYIFTETKSEKSRRNIALPPSLNLLLKAYRDKQQNICKIIEKQFSEEDLLFYHLDTGKPLRPNTVTNAWSTLCKKAGVKIIRLHDARHTHASIMLLAGIHPKIVQERLGHSSIEMTMDIYSSILPGLQESAAERFDKVFSGKIEIR